MDKQELQTDDDKFQSDSISVSSRATVSDVKSASIEMFKYMKTPGFIGLLTATCIFTGLVVLSNLHSYQFFHLIVEILCISCCFMIFTVHCLSIQLESYNAFFLLVGLGYGCAGIFLLLHIAAASPQSLLSRIEGTNKSLQAGLFTRYMEILGFYSGLLFARKWVKGPKPLIGGLIIGGFVCGLSCCILYWWKIFPDCYIYESKGDFDNLTYDIYKEDIYYDSGTTTWWNRINEYAFVVLFSGMIVYLLRRSEEFPTNVYSILVMGLFFRLLGALTGSFITNVNTSLGFRISSHSFKLLAFLLLVISIAIDTLRNPLYTMYRTLLQNQQALKMEKEFAEWMIDIVPRVVVILDERCRITHINKSAEELLGCNQRDILGRNFFDILITRVETEEAEEVTSKTRSFQHRIKEIVNNLSTSKEEELNLLNLQIPISKGLNKRRVIEWNCNVMKSYYDSIKRPKDSRVLNSDIELTVWKVGDSPIGMNPNRSIILCFGQDITEQIQREDQLLQARNEAERASRLKDTFVANVSHELRTPLNCIIGMTSILSETILVPQQAEMVNMISTASNSLLNVINDLLDFGSIQHGRLNIKKSWFNLRAFVEDVLVSMSLLIKQDSADNKQHPSSVTSSIATAVEFGYRVDRNCPEAIYSDEKRLRQIIVNLLNNAIKFTSIGQITLQVRLVDDKQELKELNEIPTRSKVSLMGVEDDGEDEDFEPVLLFEVTDSGLGIKSEDLTKLFERFSQIETANTRKYGGTGLGLAISKQLASYLGGTTGVRSEFGRGSTFWFTTKFQGNDSSSPAAHMTSGSSYSLSLVDTQMMKYSTPKLSPSSERQLVIIYMSNEIIGKLVEQSLSMDFGFNVKMVNTLDEAAQTTLEFANRMITALKLSNPGLREIPEELRPSVSLIMEVNDPQEFYIYALKQFQNLPAKVHIVMVTKNINTSLSASQSLPDVDIIGKPIRLSLLYKCLTNKKVLSDIESKLRSPRFGISASMDEIAIKQEPHTIDRSIINNESSQSLPDIIKPTMETESITETLQGPIRVLIAEDNAVNQKMVTMFLKRIGGFEFEIAVNGQEAVRLYQEKPFDLILMDCQMPIMDGYTATQEIRKIEQTTNEHILIVALTANAMEEDRQRCLASGMDEYLSKPIRIDTLKRKLASLFKQVSCNT